MSDKMQLNMEQFQELIAETIKNVVTNLGLDKVDRKYMVFPTQDDANGDNLKDMSKEQRMVKFFQSMLFGDFTTVKALSSGTGATGGYLVPQEFRNDVIMALMKQPIIRNYAIVIPVNTLTGTVPKLTGSVTTYWEGENATMTASDPAFGQLQFTCRRLNGLNYTSRELFNYSGVQLYNLLVQLFADAIKKAEDAAFMTGDGNGKPTGLRSASVQSVAQAGAAISADDIINAYYKLPSQYRANAVFLLHNDVIAKVNKLKDSTGRYLWQDSLAADKPATLLGRPVLEQNDIPTNLGVGLNESEIWFGDLKRGYYVFDLEEMGVEVTTEGAGTFEKHQAAIKVWTMLDGKPALEEAVVKLTGVK